MEELYSHYITASKKDILISKPCKRYVSVNLEQYIDINKTQPSATTMSVSVNQAELHTTSRTNHGNFDRAYNPIE